MKLNLSSDTSCSDSTRLLRLPGSFNIKSRNIHQCLIQQFNQNRYSPGELLLNSKISKVRLFDVEGLQGIQRELDQAYQRSNSGNSSISSSPSTPQHQHTHDFSGFPEDICQRAISHGGEREERHVDLKLLEGIVRGIIDEVPIERTGQRNSLIPKVVYRIRAKAGLDLGEASLRLIHDAWYRKYSDNIRTTQEDSFIELLRCYKDMPIPTQCWCMYQRSYMFSNRVIFPFGNLCNEYSLLNRVISRRMCRTSNTCLAG